MSIVEGPFLRYLENNRERLNNRFALFAGQVRPELAYAVIQGLVAPVVSKAPESNGVHVADCLMDSAFILLRKGLIGEESRSQAINLLWQNVLPLMVVRFSKDVKRLVGSLSNAVFRLEQNSESLAVEWMERLCKLSEQCNDIDAVLNTGKVLAWTLGMSEYRCSAIKIWETLSVDLKEATLKTQSPQFEHLWIHPSKSPETETTLQLVGRLGGHVDAGGLFRSPPMVGVENGDLLAFDSSGYLTVHSDCFGVQARPYPEEPRLEESQLPDHVQVCKKGAIVWGTDRIDALELAAPTSVAYAKQTLAVTVGHSFFVFLYARVAK